jgi:predicted acyltransferase
MDESSSSQPARLASLDAYRGFIMLVMASAGFGLPQVARHFGDSAVWRFLGYEFDHVAWTGCAFWDLIQPSFMFMVGVAMPFSHAGRLAKGQSLVQIAGHVLYRSLALILLGIFLSSSGSKQTNFTFVNVLTQIGLGYAFVYLLLGRGVVIQLLAALGILAGYWFLFFNHPIPAAEAVTVGLKDREYWFSGLFAHWNKNANFASDFDLWFLNLFARPEPFKYNEGGYQTLNFVPSMATMIFGLMAGAWLRGPKRPKVKFATLVVAGAICFLLGLTLDYVVCPSVKRIWTPTWAIFSTAWTLWMLAGFFGIIDLVGWRRWAFPFIVVGMNSIAMYCMSQLMKSWVGGTLKTHLDWVWQWSLARMTDESAQQTLLTDFGQHPFQGTYGPIVQSISILLALWLICLWMYRRRIFLRI